MNPKSVPVTIILLALVGVLHIATFLGNGVVRLFALNPSRTITVHFYVWNVITGCLVETNTLKALAAGGCFFWTASKLESVRGSASLIKLLTLASLGSGVAMLFLKVLLYIISGSSTKFLYHDMYGLFGLALAATVGLVHERPDTIVVPGVLLLRNIPLLFLAAYTLIWAVAGKSEAGFCHDLGMARMSLFAAFVIVNYSSARRGKAPITADMFFPDKVRPALRAAVILIIGMLQRFGVSGGAGGAFSSSSQSVYGPILPTVSSANGAAADERVRHASSKSKPVLDPIAERRRARALRALDEKLAQISKEPAVSLASLAPPPASPSSPSSPVKK